MKKFPIQLHSIYQIQKTRWLLLVVLVATTHLFCQTIMLSYGSALLSLFPGHENSSYLTQKSNPSASEDKFSDNQLNNNGVMVGNTGESTQYLIRTPESSKLVDNLQDNSLNFVKNLKDSTMDGEFSVKYGENKLDEDGVMLNKFSESKHELLSVISKNLGDGNYRNVNDSNEETKPKILKVHISSYGESHLNKTQGDRVLPINEKYILFQSDDKKKMRCLMPPKSVMYIDKMNRLLHRNRKSSRAMRPLWSSARDKEILASKVQIANAHSGKADPDLYSPLYRNVSMFRRSYELMEQTLKIYVYKDGEKPIFHQPILKGLYASEGWFMKQMEGNKRFVVKDPRKAHLFYMPFSARMLEKMFYVRNSHNRTNLRQFLKSYAEKIAVKYPFWNRTGGADHFLVACHDWAPYETRHHMEHCIKALCNADVTMGFKIGRDVSLPECYVRSARNPLRDLGGKPASERRIFAFYAGNMHGYLRKIILDYYNNTDTDMKILGPMRPGVASKMNYIEHMKSSKYCICPKGYEVNSPRVVEAIFYECVPVIISDNFVPPFFEVLDWAAFSVIVAEKDVPDLKKILDSITEEKYQKLQFGVRMVQRHFLWHVKPVKYDLFHMTLHSIWYNRVFQIKPR